MTAEKTLIEEYEETNEGRLDLAAADAAVQVIALLNRALDRSGKSQDEIAAIVGVGKSRVSQILNGDGNYTVATIAKLLKAMDDTLVITLENPLPKRQPRRVSPHRTTLNQSKTEGPKLVKVEIDSHIVWNPKHGVGMADSYALLDEGCEIIGRANSSEGSKTPPKKMSESFSSRQGLLYA